MRVTLAAKGLRPTFTLVKQHGLKVLQIRQSNITKNKLAPNRFLINFLTLIWVIFLGVRL